MLPDYSSSQSIDILRLAVSSEALYILDSNNIVPTILLKANLAENSTPSENNSTCNYIFGSLEILFWVNINESQPFYLATLDTNLRQFENNFQLRYVTL